MLQTVGEITENRLERFGADDLCIVFGDVTWTTGRVHEATCRLAGGLAHLGLTEGDRVVTYLVNCPEVLVSYAGIWRAGMVVVPLLYQLTVPEVVDRIEDAGAVAAITTLELLPRLLEAAGRAASLRHVIVLGAEPGVALPARCVAFAELLASAPARPRHPEAQGPAPTALAMILYTGGTTGAPKGVMLSHVGLTSCWHGNPRRRPGMVGLLCVPLAHVAGMMWMFTHFLNGDRIVMLPAFDAQRVLQAIAHHRVEVMTGAPAMYVAMMSSPHAHTYDTRSVEIWTYASATMPPYAIETFEKTFGGTLHSAYGLTETSGGLYFTESSASRKRASTGRLTPHAQVEVRVVGEDLREVASGEAGELWIRGPLVTPGYYGRPEATADAITDGWLKTGDLGRIDDDGDLFLLGRSKELIISGGFNVYPAEIEDVISQLPSVRACVVTALPHRLLGEQVVAFVLPRDLASANRAEIAAHCKANLADYKQPVIRFIDELPMTAVGKPDKKRLARSYAEASRELEPAGPGAVATDETPTAPAVAIPAKPSMPPSGTRRRELGQLVRGEVARLLEVAPSEVPLDAPLMELGLGSLLAIELSETLSRALGSTVSATLAFDHPTIVAITDHLARDVLGLVEERELAPARREYVREPIAIVGIGCRLPGGVHGPDALWELLQLATDATSEVPLDRWDPSRFDDPTVRRGGFVDKLDQFDPEFFGMSPVEADALDPQQRLLAEVSWEALENAGIAPGSLAGSNTGVFLGMSFNEYLYLANFRRRIGSFGGGTGGFPCVAAGRLSYLLGLKGPAFVLDTACSSSLVAAHQAFAALRAGECDLAIAGGVSTILTSKFQLALSAAGALAPDGRCKTFDAGGNGYARAEGCALIVIKRLSDALAAGDRVYGVILGSAVNHDGRSSSLTAPSGTAQQALIEEALAQAGVSPAEVGYVEAHGTGTPLGDPIEVGALSKVMSRGRPRDQPLHLGSIKANLGHLEPAAGITGLLKAVLAIHHREIPPQVHLKRTNPHLPIASIPAVIPTERVPWRTPDGQRRIAGVSSFGFSGTNVHVVLGEPPQVEQPARPLGRPLHLLCVSGKTPEALRASAVRLRHHLVEHPSLELADVCHTLAVGRTHLEHRAALTVGSLRAARDALAQLARGETGTDVSVGLARSEPRRVAFLFTGQGSQYLDMGRVLYTTQPTFRGVIDRCNDILAGVLDTSLLGVMFGAPGTTGLLDQTAYTQPALFAIGYALATLWRSWGIEPAVVAGHSLGEYTAACVAGVMSLEDGLRLVAARGRLMQALPPGGAMAAIQAPADRLEALLAPHRATVAISAINGPNSTVISGAAAAVDEIARQLEAESVMVTRLKVSHAFHSPLMDPMLAELGEKAAQIKFSAPQIPLATNVNGALMRVAPDASHWVQHTREAVQFARCLTTIGADEVDVLVEVGPHPVLLGMAREVAATASALRVPSLRRATDDWSQLLSGVAALHVAGMPIDWRGVDQDYRPHRVTLPTYPFQRKRHWLPEVVDLEGDAPANAAASTRVGDGLLGARLASPQASNAYESHKGGSNAGVFIHHRVLGSIVFPATGYLEMALQAARDALGIEHPTLTNVSFDRALVLPDDRTVPVQLVIAPGSDGSATFEIYSQPPDAEAHAPWRLHARGMAHRYNTAHSTAVPELMPPSAIASRLEREVDVDAYYAARAAGGMAWGPYFRCIEQMWQGSDRSGESLARLTLPADVPDRDRSYLAHPALLDACLQPIGLAMRTLAYGDDPYLPVGLEQLSLFRPLGTEVWAHIKLEPSVGQHMVAATITMLDDVGTTLAIMRQLTARRVDASTLRRSAGLSVVRDWFVEAEWRASPPADSDRIAPGRWLVIADRQGVGTQLRTMLAEHGHATTLIATDDEAELVAELQRGLSAPVAGVVYLRALDALDHDATAEHQRAAARRVVGGALAVAKMLAAQRTTPRLWLVTRGAQHAGGPGAAAQGALLGFGRVVATELPALRCTRVDLEGRAGGPGEVSLAGLVRELLDPDATEPELALRAGDRLVRRLRRSPPNRTSTRAVVRRDGAYLVTGGLGALGRRVAGWLLDKGAGRVIVVSRSASSTEATRVLQELDPTGTRLTAAALDLSEAGRLEDLVRSLDPAVPLRGVIHLAGMLEDGVIERQAWDSYDRVMAAKSIGAWNLHRVTRGIPLDFFVMFSSASGVLGEPGQGSYAAANAFLDGLALERVALGLPALSIAWGAWAEGMAAETEARRGSTSPRGIKPIPTEDGLEALELLLGGSACQIAVMPWEWDIVAERVAPCLVPLLSGLSQVKAAPVRRQGGQPELTLLPADQRLVELLALIENRLRNMLGILPEFVLSPDLQVADLGVDSLIAVEFRNQLSQELGRPLPPTLLYDHPTMSKLASYVSQLLVD